MKIDVLYFDEFELADRALNLLPVSTRPAWRNLCCSLKAAGTNARVYGSYGWQLLSGLGYVHAKSDFDLLLAVQDRDQADALVALLQAEAPTALRVDGELLFPDGAAVAWREYASWRAGLTRELLVKKLDSVALEPGVGLAREAGLVTTCAAPVAPVWVRTTERSTELAQ